MQSLHLVSKPLLLLLASILFWNEICFSVFSCFLSSSLQSVGKSNGNSKRNNRGELKWGFIPLVKKLDELYKHKTTLQLKHLELWTTEQFKTLHNWDSLTFFYAIRRMTSWRYYLAAHDRLFLGRSHLKWAPRAAWTTNVLKGAFLTEIASIHDRYLQYAAKGFGH